MYVREKRIRDGERSMKGVTKKLWDREKEGIMYIVGTTTKERESGLERRCCKMGIYKKSVREGWCREGIR